MAPHALQMWMRGRNGEQTAYSKLLVAERLVLRIRCYSKVGAASVNDQSAEPSLHQGSDGP